MQDDKNNADVIKDITKVLSSICEEYMLITADKLDHNNVKVYSRFTPKTLLLRLIPLLHKDLERKFLKDKCKGKEDESQGTSRSEEPESEDQEAQSGDSWPEAPA